MVNKALFCSSLQADSYGEALRKMISMLFEDLTYDARREIIDRLLTREHLDSTASHSGFAIPHCVTPDHFSITGRCGWFYAPRGVPYSYRDSKPIRHLLCAVAPEPQHSYLAACGFQVMSNPEFLAADVRSAESFMMVVREAIEGLNIDGTSLVKSSEGIEKRESYSRDATIASPLGLHARPSGRLVAIAYQHSCDIHIKRRDREDQDWVNARHVLSILSLAGSQGDVLTITASGPGAVDAVDEIAGLVEFEETWEL